MDSAWFISTKWTAQESSDYLQQRIDNNDRLFITQIVAGQHQGWLAKGTWD